MPKTLLLALALAVIILTSILTVVFNSNPAGSTSKSEIDTAINQAGYLYGQKKEMGEDFSGGHCLSNALMPNWVVDIAHSPRLVTDDLPENQCPAYLEGRAEHFVELDQEGNLIRAQ